MTNNITKSIYKTKLDQYNKFTSESGHWYSQDGEPMYTLIGANGKERNTTLRDAKSLGLVPSVTTILGMVAKPALENWKITQAIKSAVAINKSQEESMDSFVYRCKAEANQVGAKAAKEGTRIHALIESGFRGEGSNKTYERVLQYLNEEFPNETWLTEESFCAPQGYGGKIDLYSKSGIFVDFKTKDNLKNKEAAQLVYDEHGMQLSAYAQGCRFNKPTRVSVFVDRADTELVLGYVWDKSSHKKHKEMFNSILKYWQLVKNYDWQEYKV